MDLTTPGVFAPTDSMTGDQIAGFVRKFEKVGHGSFWFAEAFGRDPFALAAMMAAHYKAGATHVTLTVVPAEGTSLERTILPDERAFEALAPGHRQA